MLNILLFRPFIPNIVSGLLDKVRAVSSRREALLIAFFSIVERFRGVSGSVRLSPWSALTMNIDRLWGGCLFAPCNILNFMLKFLLVNSGWFSESDFKVRWTFLWLHALHQYLLVRFGNYWLPVDPWFGIRGFGVGFWDSGFKTKIF